MTKVMVKKKILVAGGIYHITQRAPGRELVFVENSDYLKFLSLLKETSQKSNINVFCFSLLPNHLHLLIRTNERNLDKAMKNLFEKYAMYFNAKYQRKGHVFCGVYRASACESEDYFLTVSFYIHLNAFRAGLCKSPFNYKWHSLDLYVKNTGESFVNPHPILSLFSKDPTEAKLLYKNSLQGLINAKYSNVIEDKNSLNKFYFEAYNILKQNKILPQNSVFNKILSFFEDINHFARNKQIIPESENFKRYLYTIQQLLSRGYTVSEIAKKLNRNRTAIYKIIKKHLTQPVNKKG